MQEYRHRSAGKAIAVSSYRKAKDRLDAVYDSGRLGLPFEGVLLFRDSSAGRLWSAAPAH